MSHFAFVARMQDLWLTDCHHIGLPELLTLRYSGCDSSSEVREAPAAREHLPFTHTEDCQNTGPILAGTCTCSTRLISDSDPALCTAPSDVNNAQFACLEAASADAATETFSPTVESHDAMYRLICSSLQSVEDIDERQTLTTSLTILLQFFEAEYLLTDSSCSGSSPAFPLPLVEQYTKLIKDDVSFYSADGYVNSTWLC